LSLKQVSFFLSLTQHQLAIQEVQLAAKNAAADKLIGIVSAESEKVKRERFTASEEEKRVRIIEEDVSIKTKLCEQDLRQAEPALVAAQAALNTLNKNNLTELKSFGSPPKAVINVCAAVMVLLATNGKIPRDRSWKTAKLMMVRVDQFLNDLLNYNKDNIHPNIIETLQEYLKVSSQHSHICCTYLCNYLFRIRNLIPIKLCKSLWPPLDSVPGSSIYIVITRCF